jgi:hypothetical protein
MLDTPITTWSAFQAAIREQFSSANTTRAARDEISVLRQTRSVKAYADEFQTLLIQIPNMGPEDQLDRFIRGLKDKVRIELELREPTTLAEAIRIAEKLDMIMFGARAPRQDHHQVMMSHHQPYQGPAPMEIGSVHVPRRPTLTAEDKSRLRAERRCFYCKEKNHIAALCPKKRTSQRQENGPEQGKELSH